MADHVIMELMVMCALAPAAKMAHTVKQVSIGQCNKYITNHQHSDNLKFKSMNIYDINFTFQK